MLVAVCAVCPPTTRDAAALACVCANAAAAYRGGRWPRTVRTKRSGAVLEPASGAFDVTVAPGEDVQAAVDACPSRVCVLLLPGTHEGPLQLSLEEVHVFGRGLATLRTSTDDVLTCWAPKATVDGLIIRQEAVVAAVDEDGDEGNRLGGVFICGGALRLQGRDITSTEYTGVLFVGGADTNPVVTGCTCVTTSFILFPPTPLFLIL